MPLLDLPDDRQICEVDGVFVCIRASDVKHLPGGHEVRDDITGLRLGGEDSWTLAATKDQLPVVARKLSDLLFRVLDGGPDVELPTLGTLRDLEVERELEWQRLEEERRHNMTAEERAEERKLQQEFEERQRRRGERRTTGKPS
jgi:hypothetical protein